MGLRTGRMRFRGELRRLKRDSNGEIIRDELGAQTTETEIVAKPWFNILSNNQLDNTSTAIVSQEDITIELRYSPSLIDGLTSMFLVFDGNEYDITSADDKQRRREKITVAATRRKKRK